MSDSPHNSPNVKGVVLGDETWYSYPLGEALKKTTTDSPRILGVGNEMGINWLNTKVLPSNNLSGFLGMAVTI